MQKIKLLLLVTLFFSNAHFSEALNRKSSARGERGRIVKYKLTVQPQKRNVLVEGLITNVKAKDQVKPINDITKTFDTYDENSQSLFAFEPRKDEEKQILEWFLSSVR